MNQIDQPQAVKPHEVTRAGADSASVDAATAEQTSTTMRTVRDKHLLGRIVPEACVLALCVGLFLQAGQIRTAVESGPGPAFYPRFVIGLLALAMLVLIGQGFRDYLRSARLTGTTPQEPEHAGNTDELDDHTAVSMSRIWVMSAVSVAYVLATILIGWLLATFAFVIAFLYLAGKRTLWITLPLGAVLAVGFAYIFSNFVYLALPTGVGFFDEFTYLFFELLGA